MSAADWEPPAATPRRPVVVGLALIVAVVGVALLLRGGSEELVEPAALEVEPEPRPRPEPAPSPQPEPTWVGEWRELPPAPLDGRHSAVSLVFGRGMLVWGGRDGAGDLRRDGAVYRVDAEEWYRLEDAPFGLESASGVGLWARPCTVEPCAGAVVVLGDDARTGAGAALRVDVRRRESGWRELADPPAGDWLWHTATWDGGEVLVLEDTAATGTPARLIGYDPRADAWAERPPAPFSGWSGSRSASSGPFVHMTGLLPGRARIAIATYDGQGWGEAEPAPIGGYWHPEIVTAPAGGPLVIAGNHHSEAARAFVWSPGGDWTSLPDIPGVHLRVEQHLARTGGRLIAWSGGALRRGLVLPRLDADSWEVMAQAPGARRRDAVVVWTGTRLVIWGGRATGEVLDDGAAFRLP